MGVNAWEWVRRRRLACLAGSLAVHLLVFGALFWVKSPTTIYTAKRGELLFVELPEADEQAQRGAGGGLSGGGLGAAGSGARASQVEKVPSAPRVASAPKGSGRLEQRAASAPRVPVDPEAGASAPDAAQVAAPTPTESLVRGTPRAPETPPPQSGDSSAPPRVASVPGPREPVDTRMALRRGGPGTGGAGGRGEARGGIEGEPIPLDSPDARYSDYLDRVRRMIKDKWVYPCVKNGATGRCEYKSAQLVVVFGILKSGRLQYVEVQEASGLDVYDGVAADAIKLASPFPPVPSALMAAVRAGSSGVPITARFVYILESASLVNLLR